MAKAAYIGVGNTAHKVKKMYVGVGGVARKVKKAYIGVGGVARCFFGNGNPAYYGEISGLNVNVYQPAATTVGNYALFAGGNVNSSGTANVTSYTNTLIKGTPTALSVARYDCAGASVDGYAVIGGGRTSSSKFTNVVDAYNSSLTHYTPEGFSSALASYRSATINNEYATFMGGINKNGNYSSTVYCYNSSLTQSTCVGYSSVNHAGCSVGPYAFYGGGTTGGGAKSTVIRLDSSFTKTTSNIEYARYGPGATGIGKYALFAGGGKSDDIDYNSSVYSLVHAIASDTMTMTRITSLQRSRVSPSGFTLDGHAFFVGGSDANLKQILVDIFDESLTKTTLNAINSPYGSNCTGSATVVGSYGLFGGLTYNKATNIMVFTTQ